MKANGKEQRERGGITKQAKTLRELEQNVREAARCHFANKEPIQR